MSNPATSNDAAGAAAAETISWYNFEWDHSIIVQGEMMISARAVYEFLRYPAIDMINLLRQHRERPLGGPFTSPAQDVAIIIESLDRAPGQAAHDAAREIAVMGRIPITAAINAAHWLSPALRAQLLVELGEHPMMTETALVTGPYVATYPDGSGGRNYHAVVFSINVSRLLRIAPTDKEVRIYLVPDLMTAIRDIYGRYFTDEWPGFQYPDDQTFVLSIDDSIMHRLLDYFLEDPPRRQRREYRIQSGIERPAVSMKGRFAISAERHRQIVAAKKITVDPMTDMIRIA